MELNRLTIKEAVDGLKRRDFSSRELANACLERIKKIDGKVKAFLTLIKDAALLEGEKADNLIAKDSSIFSKKPLLGIPFAVKDNYCTMGLKTTAASLVLENYIPPYDATVVKKLKGAGAIIIGKTNLDAWGHGSSTETSQFFTTRNPWDLKRLPGGSSGGSAAAIASNMTIGSVGSETAGSLRQPAAWCGVTGLKPTYGRVSRYGLIAMASSLDSPGPITKTVEDAAIVLQVIAGKDEMDATTSPRAVPDYFLSLKNRSENLRIAIPEEYFLPTMEKEVINAVKKAISVLEQYGARAEEISLLDPKYAVAVYTIIQRSEVSSNLARYDGVRYGNNRHSFGKEAKKRIMLGTYTLSSGYYDQYYLKAQKVRTLIRQDLERVFRSYDVIVAPTSPSTALKLGESEKDPMFGEAQDILVEASTMAGLTGINVPCGFSKNGLPIGMQIIGPQFGEPVVLAVSHFYQQITDWHKRKPNL